MKKFALLILATCSIVAANAQSHSWLVYGNAGYDRSTTNAGAGYSYQSTTTSWAVNPGIGYQFNNHLTVGIQGGYDRNTLSYPDLYYPYYSYGSILSTQTSWTAGAFFRYTQWLGNIFFVYGQVNMNYISQDNDMPYYPYVNGGNIPVEPYSAYSSNGFQTELFPAVGVNVYKGFALNFSFGGIGYTSLSPKDAYRGGNTDHFNITFGQQINIGISKNFACHHHSHHSYTPGMELRRLDMSDDDDTLPPPSSMHHSSHKEHHKSKKEKDDDDDDDE